MFYYISYLFQLSDCAIALCIKTAIFSLFTRTTTQLSILQLSRVSRQWQKLFQGTAQTFIFEVENKEKLLSTQLLGYLMVKSSHKHICTLHTTLLIFRIRAFCLQGWDRRYTNLRHRPHVACDAVHVVYVTSMGSSNH